MQKQNNLQDIYAVWKQDNCYICSVFSRSSCIIFLVNVNCIALLPFKNVFVYVVYAEAKIECIYLYVCG